MTQDKKYQLIAEWKKLLDGNIITLQEFESEKRKLLQDSISDNSDSEELVFLEVKPSNVNGEFGIIYPSACNSDDVESIQNIEQKKYVTKKQEEILNNQFDSESNLKNVQSPISNIPKENNKKSYIRIGLVVIGCTIIGVIFLLVYNSNNAKLQNDNSTSNAINGSSSSMVDPNGLTEIKKSDSITYDREVQTTTNNTSDSTSSAQASENQYQIGYYTTDVTSDKNVFFYNAPYESTRRSAYFDSREIVYVKELKNGFGYVEFTNTEGKTSTGWLKMNDLIYTP